MPRTRATRDTEAVVKDLRDSGCTVYMEKSVTKNMGDYNSAKVTVGATLPINPTFDEIEQVKKTLVKASEILDEEIAVQVKEMMEG